MIKNTATSDFTDLRVGNGLKISEAMTKLNVFELEWIASLLFKCPHNLLTHPLDLNMIKNLNI